MDGTAFSLSGRTGTEEDDEGGRLEADTAEPGATEFAGICCTCFLAETGIMCCCCCCCCATTGGCDWSVGTGLGCLDRRRYEPGWLGCWIREF